MDRTVCLTSPGMSILGLSPAQFRAAELAQARVAVTNSLPFTTIIKRSNAKRGIKRPSFTACHIGLICEGQGPAVVARSVEVDLQQRDVAVTFAWFAEWMPDLTN